MVLAVYLKEDIESGIRMAVILAVKVYVANGGANVEHIRGILDVAQAQAALYHLSWGALVAECKQGLGMDVGNLLETAIQRGILAG